MIILFILADFIASNSWLDGCQSAWLVRLPCLVQSFACMSMTECGTANHCVSLSEWQLSRGGAVWQWADRRREKEQKKKKVSDNKLVCWVCNLRRKKEEEEIFSRRLFSKRANAHGKTCLQDFCCSYSVNRRTCLQASCQQASPQRRNQTRRWIITSSRADAL